jgi:hypothetical protein
MKIIEEIEEQYLNLTIPEPKPSSADWNDDGYVVLKKFMPDQLIEKYEQCWLENNAEKINDEWVIHSPGGWGNPTPYMEHPALLEILSYGPLHEEMEKLISEPAGLHLNLTGWISTTRNWHQDTYLNPSHVGDYYIATWIALDDIHEDSGPFQFVPGSHMWRTVTREKVISQLPEEERDHRWPRYSEKLLTHVFEYVIERNGAEVISYTPEKGDVLLWHGRLLHRGSEPKNPNILRKALIAHYSGINHRQDMPKAQKSGDGWFFPIDGGNAGK